MNKIIFTFLLAACFLNNVSYAQNTEAVNNSNTIQQTDKATATSPAAIVISPAVKEKSPAVKEKSPAVKEKSPAVKEKSPAVKGKSANNENKQKKFSLEDLYWLSRIVQAEAGGESYEGKLAVANVILNRVKSNKYPNTIKGVIFDRKYAVQFSPTVNGTIYNKPSAQSIKAATEALNGNNNIGKYLSFSNFSTSKSKKKQVAYKKIGHHTFY